MADMFHGQGTLTVSVGEGYLSSHEAGALEKGDVIRTARPTRDPSLVLFNGMPLCPCEVVIRDERLEFRVIDKECRGRLAPDLGVKDGPLEILPVTVSLGSIQISLTELQEMDVAAPISLGKNWSKEEDAVLLVAGIPTARGKVVAIDEAMGMRVTEAAGAGFRARAIHPSGFLLKAGSTAARATDFDFREPYGAASPIVKRNSALLRDHGDPPPELSETSLDLWHAVWIEKVWFGSVLCIGLQALPGFAARCATTLLKEAAFRPVEP
jgi:flagellar motor switch/type III secretory pathway protein FliN